MPVRQWLALLTLCLCACARPNYQDAPPPADSPGCTVRFTAAGLCAQMAWENPPTKKQMGSFFLTFHSALDKSAKPVNVDPGVDIGVVLWMPRMGHGSAAVRITPLAPGQYRVDKVFFAMPGDWEIRFQLKNASGVIEEDILSFTF